MKENEIERLFKEGLNPFGMEIKKEQLRAFLIYLKELQEWNKKFNLTSIIRDEDIVIKHFIDSMTCILCFPPAKATLDSLKNLKSYTVLDIGSGAGFPGLPLKIYSSGIKLTLLDASRKKTFFLNHICKKLQLEDVLIVQNRAEICGRDANYREKYDIVVSRATGKLSTLVEYCLPFVKIDGIMIAQKGQDIKEELSGARKAIELLGGEIEEVRKINIESGLPQAEKRSLVIIK